MKNKKVISPKIIPVKIPLTPTIVLGLLLDRLQVAEWIWGIAITLTVIYWGLWIASVWIVEYINIFND